MDASNPSPYIVQAEYSFKGSNNDELCFKKGDVITVTQREEGGWWEGTLGEKTGWFPSNYVKEYKTSLPLVDTIRPPEEIQESRLLVLNDLVESEKAHVAEIRGLLENFLEPLETSQILTSDEYAQLMCNFVEVVESHEDLLINIEDCNDRVGKLFLTKAPALKKVHQSYCASHPRAIVILDKYKDELESFMERQGAATPGLLVLTTGLSKPFRRLDKYSAMLQELERYMDSSHPDRGDTQRSVAVYKDIAATCSALRRQKELELQVLTGPVRGWQGQELSSLGEIIHMGSVAVGADHRDRYFVLFPQTLLILSVSQRMSAFIYEGKLPLTNIIVKRLEDTESIKNAFEITGPMIDSIFAVCQGPAEADKWVDLLVQNMMDKRRTTAGADLKRNVSNVAVNVPPLPPPHMSPPVLSTSHHHPTIGRGVTSVPNPSQHKRSLSFNHHLNYNQYQQQQQPQIQNHPGHHRPSHGPHSMSPQHQPKIKDTTSTSQGSVKMPNQQNAKANWSITNLKPAPPMRSTVFTGPTTLNNTAPTTAVSNGLGTPQRKVAPTYEEDALVLRVIESYCAAYQNNFRNTTHSALQPWTPCLPIRGGKLKASKHFSTSNPQLPFICPSSTPANANTNNSTNSLNSSYIWREATPNNFNLYSSSIPSLNSFGYRYSLGTAAANSVGVPTVNQHYSAYQQTTAGKSASNAGPSSLPNNYGHMLEQRSLSEDRQPKVNRQHHSPSPQLKYKTASNYDNLYITSCNTPILSRKNSSQFINSQSRQSNASSRTNYQNYPPPPPPPGSNNNTNYQPLVYSSYNQTYYPPPMRPIQNLQYHQNFRSPSQASLYDRRVNRSFEAPQELIRNNTKPKHGPLRRSTPQLVGADDEDLDVYQQRHYHHHDFNTNHNHSLHGGGGGIGDPNQERSDSSRNSVNTSTSSWCCGNFVFKQWRIENEEATPTLRQVWMAMKQLQQDVSQMKNQISHLHQLMGHFETVGGANTS